MDFILPIFSEFNQLFESILFINWNYTQMGFNTQYDDGAMCHKLNGKERKKVCGLFSFACPLVFACSKFCVCVNFFFFFLLSLSNAIVFLSSWKFDRYYFEDLSLDWRYRHFRWKMCVRLVSTAQATTLDGSGRGSVLYI